MKKMQECKKKALIKYVTSNHSTCILYNSVRNLVLKIQITNETIANQGEKNLALPV